MKTKYLKSLMAAAAVFDMAYVGIAVADDMLYRIRRARKKRKKERGKQEQELKKEQQLTEIEDEDFECDWMEEEDDGGVDEDDKVRLTEDLIREASHHPVSQIVTETLFNQPEIKPILHCLSCEEKEIATSLLSAYIGYLAECAPDEEQSFPVLMELLKATNTDPDPDGLDVVGELLEDSAKEALDETMKEGSKKLPIVPLYLVNYRDYLVTLDLFWYADKHRIVEACRIIIQMVMLKLGIVYDLDEKGMVV